MQRRQALGTITNANLPTGPFAAGGAAAGAMLVKSASAHTLNDENSSSAQFSGVKAAACANNDDDLMYEIMEAELKKTAASAEEKKKPTVRFQVHEEEEEDEESDCEEEEEDEEDDFLFVSEVDKADESDEEYDEYESDEDEDGISRLPAALAAHDESALEQGMDSSSAAMSVSSPMVLDDTIKFISKLEVASDYENQSATSSPASSPEHSFDEDDEEQDMNSCMAASDNVLFNLIDYKDDCMKYMRELEKELRPKANYISKQQDITSSMRTILIDWLVEVAEEYKLHPETLHLAVSYTDRFLSQMSVLRAKLQLVGTSCMYIASKYEEITPPDIAEFVYITDDTYSKKQVLRMEHLLLKTLDFRVSQPTINWFLAHFIKFMRLSGEFDSSCRRSDAVARFDSLARYLAELTLLDGETFLGYLPSEIAASAVFLALHTLKRPLTKSVAELVGYEPAEVSACMRDLLAMHRSAATLQQQAIQDKYKQAKYEHVSLIDPAASLPDLTIRQ